MNISKHSKYFIFLSIVMLCAFYKGEINGFWAHDTYMCEAEWGSMPCTKKQINDARAEYEENIKENPNLKWPNLPVCGKSFTLKQIDNHICGIWSEGCSFGHVEMGYVVAKQKGNKIIGKFGEDIKENTPNFPNQKYENLILTIDRNGNLKDYQTYLKNKNASKIDDKNLNLVSGDDFYQKCASGIDFK